MATPATLTNALVTAVLDGTGLSEAEQARLLERNGMTAGAVRNVNGRTPLAAFARLWADLLRATDDPFVGLRIGQHIRPDRFGLTAYVAQNSCRFGEVLERLTTYGRLINDLLEYTLSVVDGQARFGVQLHSDDLDLERHAVDLTFSVLHCWARQHLEVPLRVSAVRLKHTLASSRQRYEMLFEAPVVFGCAENQLRLDAQALETQVTGVDLELGAILEQHARSELLHIPVVTHFSGRVSQWLALELGAGRPVGLAAACDRFGISARELQRKLRAASTSFRTLLDENRRALAPRLLESPDTNVEQVGFQLGYAEPTAFIRAFKKWFDVTPGEYRRARRLETRNPV